MSDALGSLLRAGDELVASYKAQLGDIALRYLQEQNCSAKAALLSLAQDVRPSVRIDQTDLKEYPAGRVEYYAEKKGNHLFTIRVFINLGDLVGSERNPTGGCAAEVEYRENERSWAKKPIDEVSLDWLIVALKKAEAITETRK